MMGNARRRATLLGLGLVVNAACGADSAGDIPPELLIDAPDEAARYPGPYGVLEGDTARNVCFDAWQSPASQGFEVAALTEVCLEDFYTPDAVGPRLLLVNTAAEWCTSCVVEFLGTSTRGSLNEEVRARSARGLSALSGIYQDVERNPATAELAADWARRFQVDFAFGVDADFALGAFADPITQPFNMLIDTRTMRIVQQIEGDQPQVLWGTVDRLLDGE